MTLSNFFRCEQAKGVASQFVPPVGLALIFMAWGCTSGPPARSSPAELIGEAVRLVNLRYVDPVDNAMLVRGCREGVLDARPGARTPPQMRGTGPYETSAAIEEIQREFSAMQPAGLAAEESARLAKACITRMMMTLGRESAYLDEGEVALLQGRGGPNAAAGVGVALSTLAGLPRVEAPMQNTPAEEGGLRHGDVIVKIDGAPTRDVPLMEIIERLRGPDGSNVTLTIDREGSPGTLQVPLVRRRISLPPGIDRQLLAPGFFLIQIHRFDHSTMGGFAQQLRVAHEYGRPSGLILDLRGNKGGDLNSSLGTAAMLLNRAALIATSRGQANEANQRYEAFPELYVPRGEATFLKTLPSDIRAIPMVVLVDHATASGAEVVAAALQDNHRAQVIGARTQGSGTVQAVFPLADRTGLRLTTARIFKISGSALDRDGVVPDKVVPSSQPASSTNAKIDEVANAAYALLEGTAPSNVDPKQPVVAACNKMTEAGNSPFGFPQERVSAMCACAASHLQINERIQAIANGLVRGKPLLADSDGSYFVSKVAAAGLSCLGDDLDKIAEGKVPAEQADVTYWLNALSSSVPATWLTEKAPTEPPHIWVPGPSEAKAGKKACLTPEYPVLARRKQATGTVTIGFLVDGDGHVSKARVLKSSGETPVHKLLDATAVAYIGQCEFKPGTVDGVPVPSWTTIEYVWKLE
jgi:carboxyl-terminal processing protease